MPGSDLGTDCALLVAAVREAGALALKSFGGPLQTWTKGTRNSPVTEADIAANELLCERLMGATPAYGWLSEESENDPARLNARRVWVIDPIDGTRAFIAGRSDWSVSAALVEDGRPVIAVLFAPATEEMFVATVGGGATRNTAPLRASTGSALAGARVGGPRLLLERIAASNAGLVPMPRVHSLALRLARVAQCERDAAIAGGNGHDWDLAAADLLVHEAGGVMTTLDGRPLIYNRPEPVHSPLVAAGRERHAILVEIVRAQAGEPA